MVTVIWPPGCGPVLDAGIRLPPSRRAPVERLKLAGFGAPLDADFEIGSASKGITGLLYSDALERGELAPVSTLGGLLALGDCEAAGVTLGSLSTHSSGLPGLPRPVRTLRRTLSLWRHGTNPYGESLGQLLVQARGVKLSAPRPRYSNFGFQLLG